MNDQQVLLALQKLLLVVDNLNTRINKLDGEKSLVIDGKDELSNLKWYLNNFLVKITDK